MSRASVRLSIGVALILVTASAYAALGPVTGTTSAGALANANTVQVTVPGLVGVDLESNLAWDFTAMNPASPTDTCVQSANKWPISITCASSGTGTVLYDPTNDTSTGTVAPAPRFGATVGAANMAALSPAGEKAIWLALFCSKTGAGPTLSVTMGAFTPAPAGFDESNFNFHGSSTQNTYAIGGARPTTTAFATGGSTQSVTTTGLPTTFGWTRADQVITMELPYNAALGSSGTTVYNSTLYYTITK